MSTPIVDSLDYLANGGMTLRQRASSEVIEISSDEEVDVKENDSYHSQVRDVEYTVANPARALAHDTRSFIDLTSEQTSQSPIDVEGMPPTKRQKLLHDITIFDDFPNNNFLLIDEEPILHPDTNIDWTIQDVFNQNSDAGHEMGLDYADSLMDIGPAVTNTLPTTSPATRDRQREGFRRKARPILERLRASGKQPKHAPYYDDTKLGVRMYRGPGFERFPVPLQDPQHRMICDLWDKKQSKRQKQRNASQIQPDAQENAFIQTLIADSENEIDTDDQSEVDDGDLDLLAQVLDVLPDVSHQFVLDLLELMTEKLVDDIKHVPSPNDVLARIMEYDDYPKERSVTSQVQDTGSTIRVRRESNGQPSYHRDATILLAEEFDFVPTCYIQKSVKEQKSLYDAFLSLHRHESAYRSSTETESPYKRLRRPRRVLEKKYTRKPNAHRDRGQWESLIIEIQAAKQQTTRAELKEKEDKEKEAAEVVNLQEHVATGKIVECQCCFDDEVPVNRTVKCQADQQHLYCFQCVERLAGSNTGSGKHEMLCMSQCGCKSQLDSDGVLKAVPTNVLRKLAFNQQHAEIDAAGIEGLEKCPHCDFKGICDPIDVDPVFSCLDPECGKVTCRVCFEPAHAPKTCDQVKKERGLLKSRHAIEEARSLAMMRTCPRCKKKTIKESGCNKLTCTCGCMSCFVCQKDISKEMYRHFGPAPKCPQNDDFDRHARDADQAEKAAIDKIRVDNPDYNENELTIEKIEKATARSNEVQARPLPEPYTLWPEQRNQQLPLQVPMQNAGPVIPMNLPPHRHVIGNAMGMDFQRPWIPNLQYNTQNFQQNGLQWFPEMPDNQYFRDDEIPAHDVTVPAGNAHAAATQAGFDFRWNEFMPFEFYMPGVPHTN